MSAAELLQLDFFNEWSVHLDCSWTSQRDVLQFRIRDDVIRTKNHQKEGEAIQFDFNLNDDEPREMAAELVNNGYLDEGNTKVAVKLMKEKIAFFSQQKRVRNQSISQQDPNKRRPSGDESKHNESEGTGDASCPRADSTGSQATTTTDHPIPANHADVKGRRNSTTKTPTKDLEAQKRKRKALQILIEDISREDNSTLVKCQLKTSKATVTFTFNCDVDTPEDISENLGEYVDSEQLLVAREQIQFIFDIAKTYRDQPELAKKICEQKHHVPAAAPGHHTSTSSTGGGDSTHPTPVHSRSSSKDLTAFVDPSPVFSDSKQLLVRSDSDDTQTTHSDVSPETTHSDVSPDRPHVEPPTKQSHLSAKESAAVSDFALPRDRSGTWHTSQLTTNRSMSMNEEKIRKASMPGRNDKPFASRPTQLTVIASGMSAPNTPMNQKRPAADGTAPGEAIYEHKKASDIAELSKSIERIMHRYDKSSALTLQQQQQSSSHNHQQQQPTHPTNYVSRSLASSPKIRKKFETRLLSAASKTDGGDLISPNDSIGTNSTTISNCNSLTCDSGFCAILPKPIRTNSVCEPLAETTKKVGRFQVGIVKEQVSPSRTPSPDAIILPAITVPPVSVPVSIASDTSLDEVTSVLARISEKSLQTSPQAVSCPQCLLDSDLDNDANLQLIKARQAAERRELEDRQQAEIEIYKTGKKALQIYSEKCDKCAQLQVRSGNSKVLCEVHSVAKLLQELAMGKSNHLSTDHKSVATPDTVEISTSCGDELDGGIGLDDDNQLSHVSSYLRSGKHCDKEASKVRRLRHNSVEKVLQRMLSSDADSPSPYIGSDVTQSAIAEESDDIIREMNAESTSAAASCQFEFPCVDRSRVIERGSSTERLRLIRDEVTQSHQAVVLGLHHQSQLHTEALMSQTNKLDKADHALTRQEMVKQALSESQAQLLKSLQNALNS